MRLPFLLAVVLLVSVVNSRSEIANAITAVVNDSVITLDEVEGGIAPIVQILVDQYRNRPDVFEQKLREARTRQIEELVETRLILADFKKSGGSVPDSLVDEWIEEIIKDRFNGDRTRFTKTLQQEGMTLEAFRQRERERKVVEYLRFKATSADKVIISPAKIEAYYQERATNYHLGDQVKLRMIVLNKSTTNDTAPRKLADEISSKIKEGAPFEEMAAVYSGGAQRAQGGDRGWVDRKVFKPELTEVAFGLKPKQTSEVIDLPEACYLLHVEEVRVNYVRPLEEVRPEIESNLKSMELARLRTKWIERLKKNAFVRYY